MTGSSRGSDLAPDTFAPGAISDATRLFNEQFREAASTRPQLYEQDPAELRAALAALAVHRSEAMDRVVSTSAGSVTVRLLIPPVIDGVYLHVHGGGWVIGGANQQDEALWQVATTANAAVVSVEYRLAPDHRYPAAIEDCEIAAGWLVENSMAEFGTDRIVVGGESAGGHLTALTLLRMRERHGFTGFAAANLVYGIFDLAMTPSVRRGLGALAWNTQTQEFCVEQFAPHVDPRDPELSPLYADLSTLPPALFTIGTLDALLDDSLFMHGRWLAAGNESELALYPGGIHGFKGLGSPLVDPANARQTAFLKEAFQQTA